MIADSSFEKKFRLLSADDFSRLKKNSESFKSHTLVIYYQSNKDLGFNHARIGLSVSKKVGKSHERNRLKRLLREHFRVSTALRENPIDLIVVAIKPRRFNESPFVEYEQEFLRNLLFAFNKLGKKE